MWHALCSFLYTSVPPPCVLHLVLCSSPPVDAHRSSLLPIIRTLYLVLFSDMCGTQRLQTSSVAHIQRTLWQAPSVTHTQSPLWHTPSVAHTQRTLWHTLCGTHPEPSVAHTALHTVSPMHARACTHTQAGTHDLKYANRHRHTVASSEWTGRC